MRQLSLVGSTFLSAVLLVGVAAPARAQYVRQNLVSDNGAPGTLTDANLVNAWGLVAGPMTPWWVANNHTGTSTLYTGAGVKIPLTVTVPGSPTGTVFNSGPGFLVNGSKALFLFDTEEGTISGWSGGAAAVIEATTPGAVYKGLAFASTLQGDFIYATNFSAGTVDVFDSTFTPVVVPGAFTDPSIPAGFAPFGIQNLSGTIYVTYAMQDADKMDDVPGPGNGYVNAFDTAGNFLRRVASGGRLDSPWGIAWAPGTFGKFAGQLLIGNFGNGGINAFDPTLNAAGEYTSKGPLTTNLGVLKIHGLWALQFGNGNLAGSTNTLFFTAGPNDENDGLFGKIDVAP